MARAPAEGTKRAAVLKHLRDGRGREEIAEILNCSLAYVSFAAHMLRSRNHLDVPRFSPRTISLIDKDRNLLDLLAAEHGMDGITLARRIIATVIHDNLVNAVLGDDW